MTRATDLERILIARRLALLNRLAGEGMSLDLADRWIDAWEAEAWSHGLEADDAAYWLAADFWITTERGKGREPLSRGISRR